MAQTPQEFFGKNMKWFALAFLILFLFKSVQSCNRNMYYNSKDKITTQLVDSLEHNIVVLNDSIKTITWENRLLQTQAESEKSKAAAVQSVAEKVKSNTTTTVNVRGAEVDTIKKSKK